MARTLAIDEAAALLQRGGVLAYPTEAVWGLGCDPDDEASVLRLLELKRRPLEKGLILVAAHLDPLRRWLDLPALPPERLAVVLASWPGPHTWVMPAAADAPRWITGGRDSIAIRISADPVVSALCEAFGGALVSTSANIGGEPPAHRRADLDPALCEAVDGIVAGETGGLAQPTPIRLARDGSILRA
jgi:L-threonylcarbamoyladenylate synthase